MLPKVKNPEFQPYHEVEIDCYQRGLRTGFLGGLGFGILVGMAFAYAVPFVLPSLKIIHIV